MAASGEDLEDGFGAGDSRGRGCAKGAGKWSEGGVGPLDLIDVRWVDGSGESAEGEEVSMWRGERVLMKAMRSTVSK